ncbi:unnamed protein product [Heligmosomoides polygyrus]|uniref:Longin domain-containing protein n=1 Tax=Heligmosomoides polygyrus TaxID=6339 RepID=A0A183G985_HELPZ|nr:unnamed protein product [Heligmosomoides polygyrus]
MERFLSIFHHEPPSTTPSLMVQEDTPPLYASFAQAGKKIMNKYFSKLRSQWSMLDRFQCNCDGDLVAVAEAKTFVTLRIFHD